MFTYEVADAKNCPKEIFHFRYTIYIDEMDRKQNYADHDTKTIRDPMDETANHFIARDKSGALIACMRINNLRDSDVGLYHDLYRFDEISPDERAVTTIGTRLMSSKEYRKTPAAIGLFRSSCAHALNNGLRYCVLDCNDYLVKHFEKMGYKRLFNVQHPEYGDVSVVKIDLYDLDYLKEIFSPLLDLCDNFQKTRSAGDPTKPFG